MNAKRIIRNVVKIASWLAFIALWVFSYRNDDPVRIAGASHQDGYKNIV